MAGSSATKRSTKKAKATAGERFIAYKGFDQKLVCDPTGKSPFQYEIGKTYTTDTAIVRCAAGGFHWVRFPLDAFRYYGPGNSRYCEVEVGGKIAEDGSDTKGASSILTVNVELTIPDMVDRAVKWILAHIEDSKRESNTGDQSAATNTGGHSAATNTGYRSAATNTGDYSAATNTGDQSAATNTGDQSAATNTGERSAATNTGDQSAATNTGGHSAATNTGYQSAATNTGDYSAATNTGYQSAATNTGGHSAATNTGYRSAAEVSGRDSVAASLGYAGRARASEGGAIVLCHRDYEYRITHIRASKVGENGIKADVWYSLDANGEFVEAKS